MKTELKLLNENNNIFFGYLKITGYFKSRYGNDWFWCLILTETGIAIFIFGSDSQTWYLVIYMYNDFVKLHIYEKLISL